VYPNLHPRVATAARIRLTAWQLQRVILYIDTHLTRTIRMDELAAVVSVSTSHFCRSFKAMTGLPPYAWILHRRVEVAQTLMLTTDLNLSEIALGCGMCDQPHFTRTFRRVVGETPDSWRRNQRNAQEALNSPGAIHDSRPRWGF
jgi:AraC family transcriptional regulator